MLPGLLNALTTGGAFGAPFPAFAQALDADIGPSNATLRMRIGAAAMTAPPWKPSRIRATFQGPSGAGSWTPSGVYIGHRAGAGDAWDAASLSQLLFSGSGTPTVASGTELTSDWLVFSWDRTSDLIVTYYDDSGTIRTKATVANCQGWYKVAVDEAATANVTGYTESNNLLVVNKIEVD